MEVSSRDKPRVTRPSPFSSAISTLSKSDENLNKCPPVTLSWHNIVVTHKKSRRVILNNVSGIVRPGEAVALMGASGAGKTTLLNTLLHRNLNGLQVEGKVLVDGIELGSKITDVSGYVQQEELFLPTLTVGEHLALQARLRLSGASPMQRAKKVDEIMNELGLMRCRDTRIGINGVKKGISGGESKRLLFAGELLNDPPLLFCDEPTTGLDSATAESVVLAIRKLAEKGHTIICTIHQPSALIFNLFHQVMFLAGGRLAYFGPPHECVEMFGRFGYSCCPDYNPADMLIETLAIEPYKEEECLERVNHICEMYNESEEGQKFQQEVAEVLNMDNGSKSAKEREFMEKARKQVIFPVQFYALLQRSLLDNWRNPALVRAKIILKIFMGIFIGLLYLKTQDDNQTGVFNITGALYFLVNELTYATAMGILSFLPDDYPLVVREYHDGLYHLISYYIARCLSYVPLFTVDGLLMMVISYWMIGLTQKFWRFCIILGISLLIEQSAAAFGVMLSTITPSYPVAIAIAAPLLTVLSLTGGMYANVGHLGNYISWIQYTSWFRYGFEAFMISQWDGVEYERHIYSRDAEKCIYRVADLSGVCVTKNNILDRYSFKEGMFFLDIGVMFALILAFYTVGFFGLLIRVRRSR
ncbi:ABC transporter domain-containing protein [Aphelenchoides bicaudatus]|nr:ABC transporter domain-containing protein [Aphelenchoides bicaudatus]